MFVAANYGTDIRKEWRLTGFVVMTGFLALGLLGLGGLALFMPWVLPTPQLEIHRWHNAELGAMTVVLLGGTLVSLLSHPKEKPLLAQFFVLSMIIIFTIVSFFVTKALTVFIVVGLFVVVYPDFRALCSFSREGPICKPLLGLALVSGVFLLPDAWVQLQWQIRGLVTNDVHALEYHWLGSALLMTLLPLAGVLASTRRAGWKELAVITGGAFCYLGLASMVLPSHPGSWGGAGGLFATSAGVWYILFTLLEAQREGKAATMNVTVRAVRPIVAFEARRGREAVSIWAGLEPVDVVEKQGGRKTRKLGDAFEAPRGRMTGKLTGALENFSRRTTRELIGAY